MQGGSATFECSIYPVHNSHKVLPSNETLYVMDTPGLDSDEAKFAIVEMIDNQLLKRGQQNELF